jgi:hypothetical protein
MALGNATQAETGSVRSCSSTGCLFGAPLPVPNPQTPFLSTCIVNEVSQNAAGSATCDGGTATLSLPLTSHLFLTGDLLSTVAGVQSCPICTGTPGAETCQGGPNDTLACTPGTSVLGQAYPTSHDCPPPPNTDIGALAIPFVLSTGSPSLGSHAEANQRHVFCGFCRDVDDGTSLFIDPPVSCTTSASCNGVHGIINGMDITFESCAQLNSGCFGSSDCATITENGVAAGSLTDHASHNITLATVFCIPPSFSALVDPSAGLPGPGATALQGTVQLLP